ncbi:hypothetical protein BOTBODRAFT_28633 [Botryobasidium botryosum FD-172 SS1]|uniref:Uncharacterized protein n=1 Tax=Botryobasidium botryosum (strain FD-172 SS1) TaxID=930990 RepID=A0A067MWS1_BOTB1|nr:hypothetical protein BOTBODRAFT_28633 [Botryobasidium botryosum FD-172 SS1]
MISTRNPLASPSVRQALSRTSSSTQVPVLAATRPGLPRRTSTRFQMALPPRGLDSPCRSAITTPVHEYFHTAHPFSPGAMPSPQIHMRNQPSFPFPAAVPPPPLPHDAAGTAPVQAITPLPATPLRSCMKKDMGLSVAIPDDARAPPDEAGESPTATQRKRPTFDPEVSYIPTRSAKAATEGSAINRLIEVTRRMDLAGGMVERFPTQPRYTIKTRPPTPYYEKPLYL